MGVGLKPMISNEGANNTLFFCEMIIVLGSGCLALRVQALCPCLFIPLGRGLRVILRPSQQDFRISSSVLINSSYFCALVSRVCWNLLTVTWSQGSYFVATM